MRASSADIAAVGLDMLVAALEASTRDEAVEKARAIASDLTADELRRVSTFLAVEAVRGLPLRRSRRSISDWVVHKRFQVLMYEVESGVADV